MNRHGGLLIVLARGLGSDELPWPSAVSGLRGLFRPAYPWLCVQPKRRSDRKDFVLSRTPVMPV